MTSLTLYGYKKCSTCRKAEKALAQFGIDYRFVDITESPPSASKLKKLIKLAGLPLKKWFNTSGVQYRELNIKDRLPDMTEAEAIQLLSGNGRLLKRPIVMDTVNGKEAVTIGYQEDTFAETWR